MKDKNIPGRTLKQALLGLAIGGVAAVGAGCLSVHVQKETDQPPTVIQQPAPVIVQPNDQPNPYPK